MFSSSVPPGQPQPIPLMASIPNIQNIVIPNTILPGTQGIPPGTMPFPAVPLKQNVQRTRTYKFSPYQPKRSSPTLGSNTPPGGENPITPPVGTPVTQHPGRKSPSPVRSRPPTAVPIPIPSQKPMPVPTSVSPGSGNIEI